MVKELLSGRCISCIPGITALNRPLAAGPGPSAKRRAENEKRELMELYTIGNQHYYPLQWDKYGSSTHPIRSNQPSSVPDPQVIFVIFNYTVY